MSAGETGTEYRAEKAYADLRAALDKLSTLKITSAPKFREWVWEVTGDTLECLKRVSEGDTKFLGVAQHNIRVLDSFYHATPQDWRRFVSQQRQHISPSRQQAQSELERLLAPLLKPPTVWQKFRDALIFQPIGVIIGSIGTWAVFHFLLHTV